MMARCSRNMLPSFNFAALIHVVLLTVIGFNKFLHWKRRRPPHNLVTVLTELNFQTIGNQYC